MVIRTFCTAVCLSLIIAFPTFPLESPPADLNPPETAKPARPAAKHLSYYVEISINRNQLTLFTKSGASEPEIVAQYPVGTVVRGLKTYPTGPGKVTGITVNPWWYPTEYSRQVFLKRGIVLPPKVPPGDPLNYMGAIKISLSHRTWKGAIYRIHGNNNPARVGRRVTGGCFVMNNDDALELAHRIRVGTEVNIVP
jgi:L,D-transpeptidase YnhG